MSVDWCDNCEQDFNRHLDYALAEPLIDYTVVEHVWAIKYFKTFCSLRCLIEYLYKKHRAKILKIILEIII